MNPLTQVQILKDAVCISLGKDMNPTILSPAMGK